jgi:soluble lytic murein transglycosylase-like protein
VLLAVDAVAAAEPVATQQRNVATAADPITAVLAEASQRFGIPASWIRAVMQVESFGDVRALSPKGAMGLMQIMPEAWVALRSRYGLGADPFDAHDNILAGAAYLRELLDRYGSPGFLAAYNAGPARYEDHLATGRALPAETQAYVAALAPVIGGGTIDDATVVNAVVRSWTEAPLFVVSAESTAAKSSASSDPRSGQRSTDGPAQDWTGLAPQSPGLFIGISHGNRQP